MVSSGFLLDSHRCLRAPVTSDETGEPPAVTTGGQAGQAPREHWSETVRRRVEDSAAGAPKSEAPRAEVPESEVPEAEADSSLDSRAVRERVERRLREAAERREVPVAARDAGSGEARPYPAAPAAPGRIPEDDLPAPAGSDGEAAEEVPGEEGLFPGESSSTARSRLAETIATCAFLGRIPWAPGTFGSAAGLGAFFLTWSLSPWIQGLLLLAVTLVGTWAAHRHAKDLGCGDPQSVVVDEFCGMWLALVAAAPSLGVALAAFLGFRALDIFKPPPVRQAERLPGGIGIMADDLLAGGIVRALVFLFAVF